jgi:hypothetical protein
MSGHRGGAAADGQNRHDQGAKEPLGRLTVRDRQYQNEKQK